MASYYIRTYLVNRFTVKSIDRLYDFLRDSIEINVNHTYNCSANYTYNEEEKTLRMKNPPDNIFVKTEILQFTVEELYEALLKNIQSIGVLTRRSLPEHFLLFEKEVIDWSKMITDLHLAGKIIVSENKNIMAVDPRKFYFVGEPQEEEVVVDFLGTRWGQEISERVIEEWRNIH